MHCWQGWSSNMTLAWRAQPHEQVHCCHEARCVQQTLHQPRRNNIPSSESMAFGSSMPFFLFLPLAPTSSSHCKLQLPSTSRPLPQHRGRHFERRRRRQHCQTTCTTILHTRHSLNRARKSLPEVIDCRHDSNTRLVIAVAHAWLSTWLKTRN